MRKSGGCKVVLMLFLGIFLGILLTIGGLAGAGFWAYNNMSITKLEQMLGTKIVNLGEYNDKPIKDLIGEFSSITSMTISEIDDKLLEGNVKKNLILDINGNKVDLTKNLFSGILQAKISTVTDEIGNIKDHLTFGLIYNDILIGSGMVLPDSPFAQKYENISLEDTLSNYGSEKIGTLFEAGHDFGNDTVKSLYDAFVSEDMTIDDLSDKEKLDKAINKVKINEILSLDSTSTGILKSLYEKDYTLGDLKDDTSYDSLAINDILNLNESSTGVLKAIYTKNWTLADLKNSSSFDTLAINDILELNESSTGVLKAIYSKNWTIANLKNSSSFDDLAVNDILSLNGSETGILGAIYTKGWTLEDLKDSNNLDSLTIGEMIDIDDTTSPKILQALKNSTTATLSSDISDLRLADVMDLGEKDYSTTGTSVMNSYKGFIGLVYETDMTDDKGPLISELDDKLNAINVNTRTLGELQARGLISASSDLTKSIGGKVLSTYTMQELIDYVVSIAS